MSDNQQEAHDLDIIAAASGVEPEPEPAAAPEPEPAAAPEPEPAAAPGSSDAALIEGVSGSLSWIPFGAYLGCWLVFAGVSAYLLSGASADEPARWMPVYGPLLWVGVGLTALGPVLSLVVWLIARARRSADARRGLLASAMSRGALVAFFGVIVWIAMLFVLETVALRGAV